MSDPIWVDTNILIHIIGGDKILEAELVKIRDLEGHELLITPKSRDELLNGNVLTQDPMSPQIPSTVERNKVRGWLDRLKVTVDMEGKKVGGHQKIFTDPRDARKKIDVGQMRRMDDTLRLLDSLTESDSLLLSEVKAGAVVRGIKKPVIFTADGGVTARAGILGIRARNPTPKTPPVPHCRRFPRRR